MPTSNPFTNLPFSASEKYPIEKIKTRAQIAAEYGVSVRTLHRWIKKSGIQVPAGALTPTHQWQIYERFGPPKSGV